MFSLSKLCKELILTTFVLSAVSISAAAADVSVGTVNTSALKLREAPSIESKTLSTAASGEKVVVFGKEGDWYKVSRDSQDGYMFAEYVTVTANADAALGTGVVTGSVVNVRSQPATSGAVLLQLKQGDAAEITGAQGGWYKIRIDSKTGFISPDYFKPAKVTLTSRSGSNEAGETAAVASASSETSAQDVIAYAKNYLGVRYVYGGSSPKGFDCSGFTVYVFKHFGISLSRTATGQYQYGSSVSKSELKPGDLVFFKNSGSSKAIGHVGIYVGGGSFIHASSPGDVVKITSLSESYYVKNYVGARRIL